MDTQGCLHPFPPPSGVEGRPLPALLRAPTPLYSAAAVLLLRPPGRNPWALPPSAAPARAPAPAPRSRGSSSTPCGPLRPPTKDHRVPRAHKRSRTHTLQEAHSHGRARTHTRSHTRTCAPVPAHARPHGPTYTRVLTHGQAHGDALTRARSCAHTRASAREGSPGAHPQALGRGRGRGRGEGQGAAARPT